MIWELLATTSLERRSDLLVVLDLVLVVLVLCCWTWLGSGLTKTAVVVVVVQMGGKWMRSWCRIECNRSAIVRVLWLLISSKGAIVKARIDVLVRTGKRQLNIAIIAKTSKVHE